MWSVEELEHGAFLLLHGTRVAQMTKARAYGIAAALNTPEGRIAFNAARIEYMQRLTMLSARRQ